MFHMRKVKGQVLKLESEIDWLVILACNEDIGVLAIVFWINVVLLWSVSYNIPFTSAKLALGKTFYAQ